jgi:hypothetical protein
MTMLIFFMIHSEGKKKETTATTSLAQYLSIHKNHIDKIVEAYKDISTAPMGVPPHCPIKKCYSIYLHTLHVAYSYTYSSHTKEYHVDKLVK